MCILLELKKFLCKYIKLLAISGPPLITSKWKNSMKLDNNETNHFDTIKFRDKIQWVGTHYCFALIVKSCWVHTIKNLFTWWIRWYKVPYCWQYFGFFRVFMLANHQEYELLVRQIFITNIYKDALKLRIPSEIWWW